MDGTEQRELRKRMHPILDLMCVVEFDWVLNLSPAYTEN